MTPTIRPALTVGGAGKIGKLVREDAAALLDTLLRQHEPTVVLGQEAFVDKAVEILGPDP